MNTAFRIRDIAAERGTKQRGYVTVGETPWVPSRSRSRSSS
jgi:hypothetical protein